MKKFFAVLMALCMLLCASAFAEESDAEVPAFSSYWVSGDAQIRILISPMDYGYELLVQEMTGENTFNSWEYLLLYDAETKSLVANGSGMKSANTFDETGMITESTYEYEDGSARFFINDADELCWDDEKEDTFSATVFHRIGLFPGSYVNENAKLKVKWAGEDLIYDVTLEMPENETQTWNWFLSGNYDPETDTLVLSGYRMLYTYLENGELDLNADKQEEEVSAVFAFDEEGKLVIPESTDPAIMGRPFEDDPEDYAGMWMWEF